MCARGRTQHGAAQQLEVSIQLTTELVREELLTLVIKDAGVSASAWDQQTPVSTHCQVDAKSGSLGSELIERLADCSGRAGKHAVVQISKDELETISSMVVVEAGQKRLESKRKEKRP